jgi:hypothetical protein
MSSPSGDTAADISGSIGTPDATVTLEHGRISKFVREAVKDGDRLEVTWKSRTGPTTWKGEVISVARKRGTAKVKYQDQEGKFLLPGRFEEDDAEIPYYCVRIVQTQRLKAADTTDDEDSEDVSHRHDTPHSTREAIRRRRDQAKNVDPSDPSVFMDATSWMDGLEAAEVPTLFIREIRTSLLEHYGHHGDAAERHRNRETIEVIYMLGRALLEAPALAAEAPSMLLATDTLISHLELSKQKSELKLTPVGVKVMADNLAERGKPQKFKDALKATMETLRATQQIQDTSRGKPGAPDTA